MTRANRAVGPGPSARRSLRRSPRAGSWCSRRGRACARGRRRLAGGLAEEVIEVGLAERAVVEPVVAHPAVNHRAFRRRYLQRGMRIQQRHDHGEAFVGRADHADPAVRLRHVLHQPIDGVIGVRSVVGAGGVEGPKPRAAASSGTGLPTRTCRARPGRRGCSRLRRTPRRSGATLDHRRLLLRCGALGGVVAGPREQHRGSLRVLGHDDHGIELDAVAHGDHHHTLLVVGGGGRRIEGDGSSSIGNDGCWAKAPVAKRDRPTAACATKLIFKRGSS